jgi:hypothetical protein
VSGKTTAELIEVDSRWMAFLAGRKAFRDGAPKPVDEWTDDQWRGRCCEGQCRLLGWMLERAMMLIKQDRIRAWAEEGKPL